MDNQESAITFRDRIAYFASIWWLRIVAFILISGFFVKGYLSFVPTKSNFAYGSLFLFLPFLACTLEYYRSEGNFATVGFSINRFAIREIIIGILLAVGGLGVIILAANILGAKLVLSGNVLILEIFALIILVTCTIEVVLRGIEQRLGAAIALTGTSLLIFYISNSDSDFTGTSTQCSINAGLAILVVSSMYVLSRSLWMPIVFTGTWMLLQNSVFVGFPDNPISLRFSGMPENLRSFFIGYDTYFGQDISSGPYNGVCLTLVLLLILAILPKITRVSPFTSAALFNQQYTESKLRAFYKLNI